MAFYPHNVSEQSISVFFNGGMKSVPASDPLFDDLAEHLAQAEHDYETVERLIDKPKMVARLSQGLVDVRGSTVYYKGEPVHSTLSYRLLDVLNAGQNASIWARFLERVMANPSQRSRDCIYDFLNAWKAPLTEDGHFIAFKRVRPDYRDIHSGKFDNSPGQAIEMPREDVDADPDRSCSSGLHVAASSYLGQFATCANNRTVACKVDPADVVAVPKDYGFAKMRVCKYVVIGDAEETFYNNAEEAPVSYVGTEAATGEIEDLDGYPICYNAVDFSDYWRRSTDIPIQEGSMVSPSAVSMSANLPNNRFLVGTVEGTETFNVDDTDRTEREYLRSLGADLSGNSVTIAEVHWQDDTVSVDLIAYTGSSVRADIIGVDFVGSLDEYEEQAYCDFCGDEEVRSEGEMCAICEDDFSRLFGEEEGIAETGCTLDGVPAEENHNGHSLGRFAHDGDEKSDVAVDDKVSEMVFERAGVRHTSSSIKDGIKAHGQRGFSRLTGVPRTTLQEWVTKIEVCEQ